MAEKANTNGNKQMPVGFNHLTKEVDNPTPQVENPCNQFLRTNGDKYLLVMVGLPARGKTYISRRLSQYLTFFQRARCEVFNVGEYRRKMFGARCTNEFFDPSVKENVDKTKLVIDSALEDLKTWFTNDTEENGATVAIFDGANCTTEGRKYINDTLRPLVETASHIIFVEAIVDDLKDEANKKRIQHNIDLAMQTMPDYEGMDRIEAAEDLRQRIAQYRKVYEPLNDSENHYSWVKMIDDGVQVSMNRIRGFIPGKIVQFLMNLQTRERPIYLSRHGESEYNVLGKIGGDSNLCLDGEGYAKDLARYVHVNILGLTPEGDFPDPNNRITPHARLYTSCLKRTKQTAKYIVNHRCDDGWVIMRPKEWRALDEIYAGAFDGMTYKEIQEKAPEEFKDRLNDKLSYRYPRGESYLDVVQRLDPIIHELERQTDPILIVAHQGILRIIYAYLMGFQLEEAPMISIPLNTVIKLSSAAYFCNEERIVLRNGDVHKEPPSH